MKKTLVVSSRGQITLPAAIRKRAGIMQGGTVIIEDRGNELVLKPAAVFEIEIYTDKQIQDWNKADRLTPTEKTSLINKAKLKR
ncbi:MAG: AbrB/MazE/SpoVT family DNA-binding domain-containing protein [Nitrospirae bacterium]|nr:AbrB/MazE/SpoVT family DNA-binding domain-containing protein [Nitrospirota bacterium]